jgi:hypothetical protein
MGSVPRILVRCFEDQACQTIKHRTVVRSLVFVDRAGFFWGAYAANYLLFPIPDPFARDRAR